MDQYMIFVAGLIVGIIVMSIIVITCNLGKAEEEEEDKKSKLDRSLDYLASKDTTNRYYPNSEGLIYLDPWEEIVRVDENKYMIKIKGRR